MERSRRVKLRDLNEHVTCYLCGGYLVDATTIVECIHTFCRSCLLTHINDGSKKCPRCGTVIHHSYPLQHIGHDRTIQDIVDKVVPRLLQDEHERKLKFYLENNLPFPDEMGIGAKKECERSSAVEDGRSSNYHRSDDQVDLLLRSANCSMRPLKRPFIQCSVNVTIKILKKYLAKHLGLGLHRHSELDILCNNELLGKDHTLRFILVTRWRSKKPPLHLEYRTRITLL